ncbi:MAG: hypothetical protein V7636_1604 [Actinomycetota bacterium]
MTPNALRRRGGHLRPTDDRLLLGRWQSRERSDEALGRQSRDHDVFSAFGGSSIDSTQDLTAGTPIPVDDEVASDDAAPAEQITGIDEFDALPPGPLGHVLRQVSGGVGVDAPASDRRLQGGLDLSPGDLEVGCNDGLTAA